MSAGSRFGFTNLVSGITSTGTASFPSTKRVRISDAAGATGLSLLSEASQPSDYKLRTVLGVDGVTTTIAGDSIQMSAGALAARVAALDLVVLKKMQYLNLYQTEADLVPAVIKTDPASLDLIFAPKAGGHVVTTTDVEVRVGDTFVMLGDRLIASETTVTANKSLQTSTNSTIIASVNTERNRAIAAEGVNSVATSDEKARAIAAEGVLSASIATNVTNDAILLSSLNAEIATRITNDADHQAQILFYNTRAVNAEGNLFNLISGEASGRSAEDIAINTRASTQTLRLTTEIADRTAGIDALNTRVAAEETLRASQIVAASAALTTEIDNRIAAVDSVTSSLDTKYNLIDTAFGNFVAVATSRDEYLLQRVDFIMKNTDSAAIDSLSELVNRQNAEAVGVYSRLQMLEDIVATLKGSPIYTVANPRDEPLAPMIGPA